MSGIRASGIGMGARNKLKNAQTLCADEPILIVTCIYRLVKGESCCVSGAVGADNFSRYGPSYQIFLIIVHVRQ